MPPDFQHRRVGYDGRVTTRVNGSSARALNSGRKPPLHVLIAYEDFASGLRAKRLFDHLVGVGGEFFSFRCHLWKFDVLDLPDLGERAVREAERADMIIISAHEGWELPTVVEEKLLPPVGSKQGPARPLVALLDSQPRGPGGSPARSRLRQLAEASAMQFFCPDKDDPALDAALLSEADVLAREPGFGGDDWGPQLGIDDHPGWGLND